jgi:hypothetical protein
MRGAQIVRVRLASRQEAGRQAARYRVRLFLRQPSIASSNASDDLVVLQGRFRATDSPLGVESQPGGQHYIRTFESVPVDEFLEITILDDTQWQSAPALCGVEVILQPVVNRGDLLHGSREARE